MYRPAVRVVLVDGDDRVLLLRYVAPDGHVYWVPPGGGLEGDEDHRAAAQRELREELGVRGVDLEDIGWRRRLVIEWAGELWDQDEVWFMARCEAADTGEGVLDALQEEGVDAVRWWTVAEILAARGLDFAPEKLGNLLPGLLAGHRSPGTREIGP